MDLRNKIIILLILIPISAFAGFGVTVYDEGQVVSSGESCGSTPYVAQETANDYWAAAGSDATTYWGQSAWVPAADKTICRVDVYVYSIVGDISAIDWQIEVYNMSGNNLGTAATGTATSDAKKITGTGWVSFTGLAAQVTTLGSYGIVLTRSDHSYGAAYVNMRTMATGNDTLIGVQSSWYSDKTTSVPHDDDVTMRIYVME